MRIVTGYKGTPHITANDEQGRNQGIFGEDSYILDVGQKFAATLVNSTTLEIQDGEGMLQGVHFRVLPGTVDTVTIQNGVVGFNRIDLVCARYTKDAVTGVENVEWAVITGTPSEGAAVEPEYNHGDVLAGDTIVDFPIYKISLEGITPTVVTPPTEQSTIAYVKDAIDTMHQRAKVYPNPSVTVQVASGHAAGAIVNFPTDGDYLWIVTATGTYNQTPSDFGSSPSITIETASGPQCSMKGFCFSEAAGVLNADSILFTVGVVYSKAGEAANIVVNPIEVPIAVTINFEGVRLI